MFLIVHGGGLVAGRRGRAERGGCEGRVAQPAGHRPGLDQLPSGTKSTPRIGPDMEADDVAAAVAYLRAHADELGIDADRIVLAGHSAGGHLSALGITRLGITVAGFVGLDSACYNVVQAMEGPHPEDPFGIAFGDDPAFWEECCPTANMTKAPPPMLLRPRPSAARPTSRRPRRSRARRSASTAAPRCTKPTWNTARSTACSAPPTRPKRRPHREGTGVRGFGDWLRPWSDFSDSAAPAPAHPELTPPTAASADDIGRPTRHGRGCYTPHESADSHNDSATVGLFHQVDDIFRRQSGISRC